MTGMGDAPVAADVPGVSGVSGVSGGNAEVNALEYLLAEMQRLQVSETARNEFMRLLRSMAGSRVYFSRSVLIKPGRVRLAQQLLDQGLSVAQARQALCERLRLPRRNAYRLISLALNKRFQARQMSLFSGLQEACDGC